MPNFAGKIRSGVPKAFKIIVYAAIILVLAAAFAASFNLKLGRFRGYSVATGSMIPKIPAGSYIIIEDADFDNLKEGDIVTFYTDVNLDGKKEIVTHYFAGYTEIGGITYFRTRSEVSKYLDSWYVKKEDLIGKLVFTVPAVGKITLFLTHPIGAATIAVDLIIVVAMFLLLDRFEEKENAVAA
jgi:signal peptidase I, archaeal type